MEFKKINATCYYFSGPVNIGYIHHGEHGMLVDAGIDKSTMKKVIKQLIDVNLPITHLFITHAHSDHFGGAQYLQKQLNIYTIAPVFEEAIMRYPNLEPLYLFGGNDPLPELHNKFLEGNPIEIDLVIDEGKHIVESFELNTFTLPGHSYNQLAVRVDDILYAADSYFSEQHLDKHKILFLTDADLAMKSLHRIKKISCHGSVPGHGEYEENFHKTINQNISYHQYLLDWLLKRINEQPKVSHETWIAAMCEHFQVKVQQLSQWLLFRTAITGYLLALIKQGKIIHRTDHGKWVFQTKS